MRTLGAISFRINELSGTLPTELGRLTLLKGVGLYNNLLSGTVPTELGALENAKSCWLNFNQCRTALDAASCGPTDNRNVFSCPEPGDSDADDPHEPLCASRNLVPWVRLERGWGPACSGSSCS